MDIQKIFKKILQLLAKKFYGRFVIVCQDGVVKEFIIEMKNIKDLQLDES